MRKGKLVTVEISPGRLIKMYEADARAKGLLATPEKKQRRKPLDKMRAKPQDKGQAEETPPEEPQAEPEQEPEEVAPLSDFTTIPGVGVGTARALEAHGITTFDQLAAAEDLDYLPAQVVAAIAEWRLTAKDEDVDPEGDEVG